MKNKIVLSEQEIRNKIYLVRGLQVMLDSDLARLYDVETKQLNRAVKRNIERFPKNFMFQLNKNEFEILRSQIVTMDSKDKPLRFQIGTSNHGGRRYAPYAFTEQGVAMLSGVLKSNTAISISIQIINAFVAMRKFISNNAQIFKRLDKTEQRLLEHDNRFERVFNLIESKDIKPEKGIKAHLS